MPPHEALLFPIALIFSSFFSSFLLFLPFLPFSPFFHPLLPSLNINWHNPLGSCFTHTYQGLSVISLLNSLSMHAPSKETSAQPMPPLRSCSVSLCPTEHTFLLIVHERYIMMWRWSRVSYGGRILLSALMFPWLLSSSDHICGKIEKVHGGQQATGIATKGTSMLPHLAVLLVESSHSKSEPDAFFALRHCVTLTLHFWHSILCFRGSKVVLFP